MTGNYIGIVSVSGTNILSPEPGSMMLLGSGILLAIGLGRRRFSR
jgi:succinyl-CoA synthetase alpha subunit